MKSTFIFINNSNDIQKTEIKEYINKKIEDSHNRQEIKESKND